MDATLVNRPLSNLPAIFTSMTKIAGSFGRAGETTIGLGLPVKSGHSGSWEPFSLIL